MNLIPGDDSPLSFCCFVSCSLRFVLVVGVVLVMLRFRCHIAAGILHICSFFLDLLFYPTAALFSDVLLSSSVLLGRIALCHWSAYACLSEVHGCLL
jgi:hypothetical protein